MLILRVLRLLGFDFSARIASARAAIEQRIERTRDEAAGVARRIAITVALMVLAAITCIALIAVGLVALYVFVSASMGVYAGLGAVAGVLAFILLAMVILLAARGGSTRRAGVPPPSPQPVAAATREAPDATATPTARRDEALSSATDSAREDLSPAAKPSTDELLAHFSTLVGTHFMSSSVHPALAEGLRYLQTAQVSRDIAAGADPLDTAASMVRDGDRKTMLAVLAGAAVLGWMASRPSRD